MILSVVCEICGETIALADTDTLRVPIMGSMFKSPDEKHGVPDPFHPSLEWEPMRCPWGPHRPFIRDDAVAFRGEKGQETYVIPENPPVQSSVEAQDESLGTGEDKGTQDKVVDSPPLVAKKKWQKRKGMSKAHRIIMEDR